MFRWGMLVAILFHLSRKGRCQLILQFAPGTSEKREGTSCPPLIEIVNSHKTLKHRHKLASKVDY